MLGDPGNIKETKINVPCFPGLSGRREATQKHRILIQPMVRAGMVSVQSMTGAQKNKSGFCLGALGSREVMPLELVPEDTRKAARQES